MKRLAIILLLFLFLGLAASMVLGQVNEFAIPKWSTNAGGGLVGAGGYTLIGSIGNADASAPLQGETYRLTGGFHMGSEVRLIHLPFMKR